MSKDGLNIAKNDDNCKLSNYSKKDAPWDARRQETEDVGRIYSDAHFERYAQRMADCSGRLGFKWLTDTDTGEMSLKLNKAQFCRVRHCPVCQWRRQLMWQARFYDAIPEIIETHPKARWLFLTFTVRNCDITNLSDTLQDLNQAWRRLVMRKEFKSVLGWVRSTEITHSDSSAGNAHPHFHVLAMVKPSYFTISYVKQADWVKLWQSCLRVDYLPGVNIKVVKPKDKSIQAGSAEFLRSAVKETLKYSVKPSDMTQHDPSWFLELTKQTHRKRVIACGGVLKNVLRVDEESNDDLMLKDDNVEEEQEQDIELFFKYQNRHYYRD